MKQPGEELQETVTELDDRAVVEVAVGISQGLLAEEVRVELPGGRLDIAWKGPGHPLYMTGPAAHVYDGFIHL